jgi:hypothetical protein
MCEKSGRIFFIEPRTIDCRLTAGFPSSVQTRKRVVAPLGRFVVGERRELAVCDVAKIAGQIHEFVVAGHEMYGTASKR